MATHQRRKNHYLLLSVCLLLGLSLLWHFQFANDEIEPAPATWMSGEVTDSNQPLATASTPRAIAANSPALTNTGSRAESKRHDQSREKATNNSKTTAKPAATNTPVPPLESELVTEIVDKFPLNEAGEVTVDNATKNYLNQVYNSMKTRFRDGQFVDDNLTLITTALANELPEAVAGQASGLAQNYFAYRQAEEGILVPELNGEALLAMFEQSVQLRRAYLGEAMANELFAEEEAMARYSISARILSEDPELTEAEKVEKSEALQTAFNDLFARVANPETDAAIAELPR
ncbi:lipase secretion chaperone [Halioxenophilus sp. WMMB6]|uniref:lipase secretion chaperone n=1 Tax=Halioxenophilus sp. WMMB6 TaxID=3073815 RepID=UPI00295F5481|nr:lipase secretion chaperone [Halioxenophilus sp. WMMB6]